MKIIDLDPLLMVLTNTQHEFAESSLHGARQKGHAMATLLYPAKYFVQPCMTFMPWNYYCKRTVAPQIRKYSKFPATKLYEILLFHTSRAKEI